MYPLYLHDGKARKILTIKTIEITEKSRGKNFVPFVTLWFIKIMDLRDRANQLSKEIISAAIDVHKALGPGLLESAYEACLCHELALRKIPFERQLSLPVEYKGIKLDCAYRIDLLVDKLVIVELKAVKEVQSVDEAQLLTYLHLKKLWLGLLINFNVKLLKDGIKRIVN